MKGRILAVGCDEDLLLTRLSVLKTQWSAKIAHQTDTLKLLEEDQFDVVVLCHSIPRRRAKSLVSAIRNNFPEVRILALESSPGAAAGLGACATAVSAYGPSPMLESIAALLEPSGGRGD
jgi:DNA-binding NarL/FixJ family response regulator